MGGPQLLRDVPVKSLVHYIVMKVVQIVLVYAITGTKSTSMG